jgi:acyl-CoA thioester hydrolase
LTLNPHVHKAQYYETDQMGVVHHSNYIRWFEEARVDFMEQMGYGYDRVEVGGVVFPVLGVSCEYKSMTRFGEVVLIHCSITELTPARMVISYRVEDRATGALRATGESKHCFLGQSGRPGSLKKLLPELYGLFLQNAGE